MSNFSFLTNSSNSGYFFICCSIKSETLSSRLFSFIVDTGKLNVSGIDFLL